MLVACQYIIQAFGAQLIAIPPELATSLPTFLQI